MVHKTQTGEEIKSAEAEIKQLKEALFAFSKAIELGKDHSMQTRGLQSQVMKLLGKVEDAQARAVALKASGRARLEDLHIYQVEKIRGKAQKAQCYWHASWRVEGKVKNVYLGSCKNMEYDAALKKARTLKEKYL